MMNFVRNFFGNLSASVNKEPIIGLLIMIIVSAGLMSIIYRFGKDIGSIVYSFMH